MRELLDPTKNPLTYALPFFVLSLLIELAALRWLDHDDNLSGYYARDAAVSIGMGAISLVFGLALKVGSFVVYSVLYNEIPWHLPVDVWWYWVTLVVAVDFLFYWTHRFMHRVNVGWAAHQAHHSSTYLNFATALRQKWNPWFDFFFWLPLPLTGFAPWSIYVAFNLNLIYQFFTHTELIDRLWRPVEWVLNTPSHHRVHHGSDPEYLDRNYAGIFIVWDRLFGTFTPERRRPTYGLTTPVHTHNMVRLQYGHYAALGRAVRTAQSWPDRLGYLFRPPGWEPARLAAVEAATPAESTPRSPSPPLG